MHAEQRTSPVVLCLSLVVAATLALDSGRAWGAATEIIDASGDGAGNTLELPAFLVVDASGNAFVAGSGRVFRVTPAGVITMMIGPAGDGAGHPVEDIGGLAVDLAGNLYVTSHNPSVIGQDYVFKVTPAGAISVIADILGDGAGNAMEDPAGVATDVAGNVYVAARNTDNVFRITPAGVVTEILDSTGDGTYALNDPNGIATDAGGNVFVAARWSDNVFRISPGGTATQILDASGDGGGYAFLCDLCPIVVDGSGNVFVAGDDADNVFRITPGGSVTKILDVSGDGVEHLFYPARLAVDDVGNVYASGSNVFRVRPNGAIEHLLSVRGTLDGIFYENPFTLATAGPDLLFAGLTSDNAIRISFVCGDGAVDPLEECDDGNPISCDGCSASCEIDGICGDGVLDSGCEECDDGNAVPGDGCEPDCTLTLCGNGVQDPGEECDEGGETAGCDADCSAVLCGDGVINEPAGEICDDGNATPGDGCDESCQVEPDSTCVGEPSVCTTGTPRTGFQLLIKNKLPDDEAKNKIVFMTRDTGITAPDPGSSDDPRCVADGGSGTGAVIAITSTTSGQSFSWPLPCENWRLIGSETSPKGFHYRDKELDEGPCKLVLVKPAKLARAICQGRGPAALDYDLQTGQLQSPVSVVLRLGEAHGQCAEFDAASVVKDGSDGKTFLAKRAAAPASCP